MKKRIACLALASAILLPTVATLTGCGGDEVKILRVYNVEEYIDEGGEEGYVFNELMEGEGDPAEANHIVDDFAIWYEEVYGEKVKVEYSCFGTNEDLYNQILLGDKYDLVCPSDYMMMKLASEGRLEQYDESFFNEEDENNYYVANLSEYVANVFEEKTVTVIETGEEYAWSAFFAGYMWGTTGLIYNPETVDVEDLEAEDWKILLSEDYTNVSTTKDNVRDCYFVGLAILYHDELLELKEKNEEGLISDTDYNLTIAEIMNRTDDESIAGVQEILIEMKDNIYGFENDTGKTDMVKGIISMNLAYGGDAVYAMDLAEEEEVYLNYYIPSTASNLFFDGWVMPKGANKELAQAFVNYLSMPESIVRNMYYIGYSSCMACDEVFEYISDCYSVEEGDEEEAVPYDLRYFFGDSEDYILYTYEDQLERQLYAQYPTEEVMKRLAVMDYFEEKVNDKVNELWTQVKGASLDAWAIIVVCLSVVVIAGFVVYVKFGSKIDWFRLKPKKGYKLVKQEPYKNV